MADLDRRRQVVGYVQSLPLAHRAVIGAALVVAVLGGFLFFQWVSQPSWTVVASGLEAAKVSEATAVLEDRGIGSRVTDGNNIEVNRSDRFDAKAALEEEGVLSAGELGTLVGNEILDEQGFSVTDDLQQENIRRALEGELGRTLAAMDFVDSARVALVTPEVALFEDQQAPVQASVALDLASSPTSGDIDSVVLFVAGAVEGLEPDQVTVVDTTGRVWHAPNTSGGTTAEASANLTYQSQVESALEAEVRGLLGGLEVQHDVVLTADINFDDVVIENVTYTPPVDGDEPLSVRESTQSEEMTGAGVGNGGIPGVDGGAIEVGDDGEFTYTNEIVNRENVVDSQTVRQVQATGTIEQINVAIAVDDGTLSGATVPSPAQIVTLVSAGLGLDPANNGDQIAVEAYPFAPVEEGELVTAAAGESMDLFALVGQVVGALALILVVVALFLLSRRSRPEEDDVELEEAEEVVLELEKPDQRFSELDFEAAEVRENVVELVRTKPEEIAGLLRGWLSER